jgi:hypothetical protein
MHVMYKYFLLKLVISLTLIVICKLFLRSHIVRLEHQSERKIQIQNIKKHNSFENITDHKKINLLNFRHRGLSRLLIIIQGNGSNFRNMTNNGLDKKRKVSNDLLNNFWILLHSTSTTTVYRK